MKTTLSFKVIEQALRNKGCAHLSYVAVPRVKTSRSFHYKVCEAFGVGVILYDSRCRTYNGLVIERVLPKFNRNIKKQKLRDWMKQSNSGSQSDRVTPFQNTIAKIVEYLEVNGDSSIESALKYAEHHYASIQSAKSSIYGLIRNGVIKEFGMQNGEFYLKRKL